MALLVLLFSFLSSNAQGFKLVGTVTGLPDSTWLYLRTASPERKIDSARVIEGKFVLTGKLDEKAMRVILHTERYTNYVIFWMENTTMHIAVKSGAFKKAVIDGSAVQKEDELLMKQRQPVVQRRDSLAKLLDAATSKEEQASLRSKINDTRNEEKQLDMDYVKTHPRSLIAVHLLSVYASTWGKDTAQALFANLDPQMQYTLYGKDVSAFIALNKNPRVGDRYADFEQTNAAGKKIKLSGIRGKYVLLEFWASWCGPCREENPALVKTYQLYKNKGFAILGVSLDDNKHNWLTAIQNDGLPWENVSDLNGDKNRAALIYGISGIPDNFLIDGKGTIIARGLRGQALQKKLEELLP